MSRPSTVGLGLGAVGAGMMQAYIGFRVAEFTAAVGAAFVLTGLGFAMAGRPA